jgi:hypothetical protein
MNFPNHSRDEVLLWLEARSANWRQEVARHLRVLPPNARTASLTEAADIADALAAGLRHQEPTVSSSSHSTCVHTESEDGEFWRTGCGHDVVWEDGPPSRHGCIYCGRCGGRIVEVPWAEPQEGEE